MAHAKPALDWLRFGAALMVVVKHAKDNSFLGFGQLDPASHGALTKVLFALSRYGEEAVLVFFVLSGFLVGGATFRRIGRGDFDLRGYAADRASRVMLPLAPAILLTWALSWFLGDAASLASVVGNLASLQGVIVGPMPYNVPLWSLSYEVWFYILNGAIALFLAKRGGVAAAIVLGAALLVFSVLRLDYLACWYLGALACMSPVTQARKAWLAGAALLVVAGCLFREAAENPALGLESWKVTARLFLGGAMMLLIREMAALGVREDALARLGAQLAGFSYSLYLIHYPILNLIRHWYGPSVAVGGASIIGFLGRIVICLLGGWLFYSAFERHTPVVRGWLRSRREALRAAA